MVNCAVLGAVFDSSGLFAPKCAHGLAKRDALGRFNLQLIGHIFIEE